LCFVPVAKTEINSSWKKGLVKAWMRNENPAAIRQGHVSSPRQGDWEGHLPVLLLSDIEAGKACDFSYRICIMHVRACRSSITRGSYFQSQRPSHPSSQISKKKYQKKIFPRVFRKEIKGRGGKHAKETPRAFKRNSLKEGRDKNIYCEEGEKEMS
jgi:hypothetical protein